jgi:ribosomal protein S18 acetylase RimI-like enzyme
VSLDTPARRREVPLVISLELHTRLCGEGDLAALEWYGMYTHHREIIADAYRRQLACENDMLICELAGFPVAQVWIDLSKRRSERIGVLWALRVFPFLRGRGIGSTLLARAENRLRARQFVGAEVGVEKTNTAARRLYERRGYRSIGSVCERYSYVSNGARVDAVADQWLLRKPLSLE